MYGAFRKFLDLTLGSLACCLKGGEALSFPNSVCLVSNQEAFLAVMLAGIDWDSGGFRFDYLKRSVTSLSPEPFRVNSSL